MVRLSQICAHCFRVGVFRRVDERRKVYRPKLTASGPEMFGISDPQVRLLIEELTNADRCKNYIKVADRNN